MLLCVLKIWFLGSQSICVVSFGFPIIGGPMLGNPNTPCFLRSFSLLHKVTPFLSWFSHPLSTNPLFSFSSPIYKLR